MSLKESLKGTSASSSSEGAHPKVPSNATNPIENEEMVIMKKRRREFKYCMLLTELRTLGMVGSEEKHEVVKIC